MTRGRAHAVGQELPDEALERRRGGLAHDTERRAEVRDTPVDVRAGDEQSPDDADSRVRGDPLIYTLCPDESVTGFLHVAIFLRIDYRYSRRGYTGVRRGPAKAKVLLVSYSR